MSILDPTPVTLRQLDSNGRWRATVRRLQDGRYQAVALLTPGAAATAPVGVGPTAIGAMIDLALNAGDPAYFGLQRWRDASSATAVPVLAQSFQEVLNPDYAASTMRYHERQQGSIAAINPNTSFRLASYVSDNLRGNPKYRPQLDRLVAHRLNLVEQALPAGTSLALAFLPEANVSGATLEGVDLSGAELGGVQCKHPGHFKGMILRDAKLAPVVHRSDDSHDGFYSRSQIRGDLRQVDARGAVLDQAILIGDLAGFQASGASCVGALFSADITEVPHEHQGTPNLNRIAFHKADCTDARFIGDIRGADFSGAVLTHAAFEGGDLTAANLTGCTGLGTARLGGACAVPRWALQENITGAVAEATNSAASGSPAMDALDAAFRARGYGPIGYAADGHLVVWAQRKDERLDELVPAESLAWVHGVLPATKDPAVELRRDITRAVAEGVIEGYMRVSGVNPDHSSERQEKTSLAYGLAHRIHYAPDSGRITDKKSGVSINDRDVPVLVERWKLAARPQVQSQGRGISR